MFATPLLMTSTSTTWEAFILVPEVVSNFKNDFGTPGEDHPAWPDLSLFLQRAELIVKDEAVIINFQRYESKLGASLSLSLSYWHYLL